MLTVTITGIGGWVTAVLLAGMTVTAPLVTYFMGKDEGKWQAKVRSWDEEDEP